MSDDPTQPATEGVEPTIADAVTDPTMAPFDDDAVDDAKRLHGSGD